LQSEDFRKRKKQGFSTMKLKLIGLALAGAMFIASPASAMVLSLTGGTSEPFPTGFNPSGFPAIALPGTVTVYGGGDNGFGLNLSSAATLNFEYLGKEGTFSNTFDLGGTLFTTASIVGSTASAAVGGGLVPFTFTTTGGGGASATNGGPIASNLSIAFANLGDGSFLAMFNDGGGPDADFDDLVVKVSVSQVPLPAAVWLLLSAVMGLVSFSTIRRRGSQTA
jgi:hypothetical protein